MEIKKIEKLPPEVMKKAKKLGNIVDDLNELTDRLKAIETLCSVVNGGYDAEFLAGNIDGARDRLTEEGAKKKVKEFGKIITDCYVISHGGVSECCKGGGADKVKELLEIRKNF